MSGSTRARQLRQQMTPWEKLLWQRLRRNGTGFHFRRQHPFGPYVLDFYCHETKLCVEVDRDGHAAFHAARDAERDEFLSDRGIFTLRLSNGRVGGETEECLREIAEICRVRCFED